MRYWKCVKVDDDFPYFTVGKIYTSDAKGCGMIDDNDYQFVLSVDELKKWYQFVEVNAPCVTIATDGRKTIATLYKDGKPVRTRYCVCHEDDKYDFIIGAEIAMKRLFDKNYARSFKRMFSVGDKVEVFAPIYTDPYNVSFFTEENIKYFNKFLYGKTVEKNAFGTIVAKKGTTCLIDKATFEKGQHYIIVDERGLKKL